MKPSPSYRLLAAAAAAALLAASASAAPRKAAAPAKAAPVPAAESAQPQAKTGFFSRVKNAIPFINRRQPQAAPVAPAKVKTAAQPAAAPPAKKTKAPVAKAALKTAPAKTAAVPVQAAAPQKVGFFRNMIARVKPVIARVTPGRSAKPQVAVAKTAAPAPVKAKKAEVVVAATPAPRKSRWGFFRSWRDHLNAPLEHEQLASSVPGDQRIERPKDWSQYRVIRSEDVAFYKDGPSQLNGADERLAPGTLVKMTNSEKGWAIVEVQGENKRTGYIDALALRSAEKSDFNDPPPPAPVVPMLTASTGSSYLEPWAPLAPLPDLPEQPGATDAMEAALLLPPLIDLEPKP